jgi:hypothetical protein
LLFRKKQTEDFTWKGASFQEYNPGGQSEPGDGKEHMVKRGGGGKREQRKVI